VAASEQVFLGGPAFAGTTALTLRPISSKKLRDGSCFL
jgi:hypothetical protein